MQSVLSETRQTTTQRWSKLERLWDADPGTDDGDKLDILATLVEKYENEHWSIDTSRVDAVDMLTYLIEEGGHTQAELAELLRY
jgi:HTH-type transcriptional regulator/antitoxin HigA